jgi:hypothetical protein
MKSAVKKLGVVGVAGAMVLLALHLYLLDGINGWVFSKLAVGGEDTQYASGYTDSAFRAIRVGMPKEKVRELLGPPLDVGTSDPPKRLEIWRYSWSPSDTNYRIRVVHLRDGVVVDKVSEFYVD